MTYPKIGIRPTIDGRWGGVRESLEAQTMGMATAAKALIEENLHYPQHIQAGRCLLKNFRKIQRCHRLSVQMHQKQTVKFMMESISRFIIIYITVILRVIVCSHK